jgi:lipopolysaccharide/colanic/teichoic acid biosynthesis glycosyltransferase
MLRAPTTTKTRINGRSHETVLDRARLQQASKAAFDYFLVIPALFMLLPLFVIIAVLIKLESPGPILHRQRVIGKRGRFFEAYNFRTTFVDGNDRLIRNRDQWVALLNGKNAASDPRVTRVGYFLRRWGLEDLPRLINILNRDMSLVGPHLLNQNDIVRLGVRRVELITSVRPGMTGLWQMRAFNTSERELHSLEIEYVNNWSLRTDLQILLETFNAIREGNIL